MWLWRKTGYQRSLNICLEVPEAFWCILSSITEDKQRLRQLSMSFEDHSRTNQITLSLGHKYLLSFVLKALTWAHCKTCHQKIGIKRCDMNWLQHNVLSYLCLICTMWKSPPNSCLVLLEALIALINLWVQHLWRRFYMMNQRQPAIFYYFRNLTGENPIDVSESEDPPGFTNAGVTAKSPVLYLAAPNEPTQIHMSLTNITG